MQRTSRKKVPFGIGQIGKSFRNEITPGNFTFRTREFEQMELEFFCKPGTDLELSLIHILIQKEREEVLDVTQEDIRGLAGIIQAVLDTGALCVVGNGQKIREDEALFKNIQNLYH